MMRSSPRLLFFLASYFASSFDIHKVALSFNINTDSHLRENCQYLSYSKKFFLSG